VLVLGAGSSGAVCHFTSANCHIGPWLWPGSSDNESSQFVQSVDSNSSLTGQFEPGLRVRVVLRGYTVPTDFAFTDPNHVLISEKRGVIWEADLATAKRRIVLDLRKETNTAFFRGVMTVAADPDFEANHFVYVVYSVRAAHAAPEAPTTVRLTRFTLGPSGVGRDPRVLLGAIRGRSCAALPAAVDCIPGDVDHLGAQIAFAKDGTLFVSTGDGGGRDRRVEKSALRAQDVDSLGGKVLHITRNGLGVPANPFFDGNPRHNRSKVWALGLRNPFRLARDPRKGTLVTGDVGAFRFDEIDVVRRGADLGWPCFEGNVHHKPYASTAVCRGVYARTAALTRPVLTEPAKTVIAGGTFVSSTLARDLQGAYLYASAGRGWLRALSFSARDLAARSHVLARNLPGPIAIHTDAAGELFILCLGTGDLLQVSAQS
jgi:glucose/arabinose dehydrogenase